ncbi:group II intron reverse transcriptase/maturase [Ammonicoccus fulvus]|uniref:Group II intron reverse transcriptase/maturase n=1 Tax=Ammonicoccus fulvus TaxID=3138240 RepID=A0ABZ3FX29_9ACTN
MAVVLESPVRAELRVLGIQTKFHRWAVADSSRRFDDLFNLVADPAFLATAWERVRGNKGARSAGIDGATAREIERSVRGVDGFLANLRDDLRNRTFEPLPVRERMIPKSGGKLRRLGIPTVRDRVVQASLKLVLEPILEADFQPCSYGFRPKRRAQDAIEEIRLFARTGYEWVFEGDIAACFDEIDHPALMDRLRRRIGDKRVLALVKAFLKAGLLDENGVNRETHTGTPQGGILSPLLANLALGVLDEHFATKAGLLRNATARYRHRLRGGATYRLVRYADDFVVLVFGNQQHAHALWDEIADVLAEVGLRLAPEKTQVVHIDEGFDFLGFRIRRHYQRGSNRRHVYTYPSQKSMASIRRKVNAVTDQITSSTVSEVFGRLSSITRGWALYFRHGASSAAYHDLQHHLWWSIWRWLRKRHPRRSAKWLRKRYFTIHRWWPSAEDGVSPWKPTTMTIIRYRYRGTAIPTPWAPCTNAHPTQLVESRMR